MMITKHEAILILAKYISEKDADKLLSHASELIAKEVKDAKQDSLTKQDKLELVDRMNRLGNRIDKLEVSVTSWIDQQANWLAGFMIALFLLAVAILK